jgi:hypothetical protein
MPELPPPHPDTNTTKITEIKLRTTHRTLQIRDTTTNSHQLPAIQTSTTQNLNLQSPVVIRQPNNPIIPLLG